MLLSFLQWKCHLIWIRREICTDQAPFISENSPKQFNKYVGVFWCERTTGRNFSLKEVLLWIMDSYFGQKWWFTVKNALMMDLFLTNMQLFKMLIDGLEWCRLLWCFYQLFGLSFWRHPFTAEHPLMSKWCNAQFLQNCSDEETNSSTSWMIQGWVNCQQIFILGWNIPLNICNTCLTVFLHVKLNTFKIVILGYFPLQILTMFEENYPESLKKVLLIKGE